MNIVDSHCPQPKIRSYLRSSPTKYKLSSILSGSNHPKKNKFKDFRTIIMALPLLEPY